MTKCALRVAPILNRCVIFNTTDFAYHGHPDPLQCPEGMRRKSLALYYYSNGRPAEEISEEHTTLFRHRPNENQRAKNPAARKAKRFAKKLVPPIVIDLFKLMRK
jgi:hypothetical protein